MADSFGALSDVDNVLIFLQNNFPLIIEHKYLFLFLGGMLEGLNSIVLGGFLASIGAVKLVPMFLLFVVSYSLSGYMWYAVGYFGGAKPIDKWGRKDEKSRKIIEKVEEYFNRYSGRAIILTKLTFSLTIATLIMAGSLKYDFRKFHLYNFLGSLGWVALTFFMGFFFGESYKFLFNYIKNFVYIALFLGLAILAIYIIKLVFKSAFIKSLFITAKVRELSAKVKDGIDEFLNGGIEK